METEAKLERRGIRVGLVMNGGVSLAVWMGGMARELHLAAMASEGGPVPPTAQPAPDDKPGRLWLLLLARADVWIDIDVVAGASAGGLNGTILAACLAQGSDFPDLREVWMSTAQLTRGKLLRPLESQGDAEAPRPSLLNGTFFEDEIREQFALIEQSGQLDRRRDVECLVTATALGTEHLEMVDDYGRAQDYVDSRRIYRFAYSPATFRFDPDNEEFDATDEGNGFTDSDTTARAARASCSFPVAFAPVPESAALSQRRWSARRSASGVLASVTDDLDSLSRTWLMDGGVLDNAPFEPVLEAIQRRPIDGPWRRVLAYVVPSGASPGVPTPPTIPAGQKDYELPAQPGVDKVLGSVVSAWRESDSRLDAEELEAHRAAATRADFTAERLIDEARSLAPAKPPTWLKAGRPLFDAYVARRQRVLEKTMDEGAGWLVPTTLAVDDTRWNWGDAVALKILRWWGRELNALNADAEKVQQLGAAQARVIPKALQQLGKVQARAMAVSEAMDRLRLESGMQPSTSREAIVEANASGPDDRVQKSLVALLRLVRKGSQMYAAALRGDEIPTFNSDLATGELATDGDEHLRRALIVEIITFAGSSGVDLIDTPPFSYIRMGPDVDSPASPVTDPTKRGWWGSAKLYGTALNHFAGFIDPTWRRHDWTWGRLDAVAHLVSLVVMESRSIPEDQKEALVKEWQKLIQEAVLRDEEQPGIEGWTAWAQAFADADGATNETVLSALHTSPQGRELLRHSYDEALGLATTLAGDRSEVAKGIARLARNALFLEEPRPASGASGARTFLSRHTVGSKIREWIEKWIDGEHKS